MTNEFSHTIDAKGRLFIPAQLRKELGEVMYICKGLGGCVFVYSEENWRKFEDRINDLPISQTIEIQRAIFTTACRCEPDAQGRILLSQKLREYGELEKNVMVNGVGNHAEIWNKEKWEAAEAKRNAISMESYMDQLGF